MTFPQRLVTITVALTTIVPAGFAAAEGTDTTTPDTIPASTVPATSVPQTTTTSTLPPVSEPQRGRGAIGFARVVISEQRVYVYNKRKRLIATLPASTGLFDTTPTGTFKVFSKSAQAYYAPSPNERMRFMTRFTKGREGGNIGFHGIPYKVTKAGEIPFPTPLGVAPSSHGCVRMRVADAKWLFSNMKIGTVISVVRSRR
jgi:lipoprotein-anchoring transpeptidase ErfK/SrfK